MKNLLTATLPGLALLALGGCASTGALTTSTETDGIYYSSKDRTTAVGSPAGVYSGNGTYGAAGTIPARALDDTTPASVATTEDANPDYQGGTTSQTDAGSDYYNNSYSAYNTSGFGQPYTGPGVSSFNYSPGTNYAASPSYYGSPYGYASAFGYGYSPFSYGYGMGGFGSPYGGFYDPYYSSLYSPFGYGFGSGLSIGFGYGFGGFGSPYGYGYSPFGYGSYGYGYGRGYYDSYYGGGYSRPVIYANGTSTGSGANPILVGPRGGRGGSVMNNAAAADPNAVNNANGRRATSTYSTGGLAAPSPTYNSATGQPAYNQSASKAGRAATNFGGGQGVGQPTYSTPGATTGQNAGAIQQAQGAGRRGFFSGFFGNGTGTSPGTTAGGDQSAQRRSYSQPQSNSAGTQQRTYNQPQAQSQRTYSQPTYTQPQQARSFGGGNFGGGGGGGSFGGGGGGGGGRRGGR